MPHPTLSETTSRRLPRYEFQEREDPRPWEVFYLVVDKMEQRIVIESDEGVTLEWLSHMMNGARRIGEPPSQIKRTAG